VNGPFVVHETIEGEVIIVNLDSGSYYSLDGAGVVVWAQVTQGASAADTAAALQRVYDAPTEALKAAADQLLSQLLAEDLIRPASVRNEPGALPASPAPVEKQPFALPLLNKHTDMQDLLLLDPIHEVDEAGWPSAKQ
jgi:hypothetical protein